MLLGSPHRSQVLRDADGRNGQFDWRDRLPHSGRRQTRKYRPLVVATVPIVAGRRFAHAPFRSPIVYWRQVALPAALVPQLRFPSGFQLTCVLLPCPLHNTPSPTILTLRQGCPRNLRSPISPTPSTRPRPHAALPPHAHQHTTRPPSRHHTSISTRHDLLHPQPPQHRIHLPQLPQHGTHLTHHPIPPPPHSPAPHPARSPPTPPSSTRHSPPPTPPPTPPPSSQSTPPTAPP